MSSQQIVSQSIQSAVSSGQISSTTAETMLESLDDVAIAGCHGIAVDELDSEEVTLVSVIIDASGSMISHRNTVIDAYNNQFLKPIQGAKNAKSILVSTWIFSRLMTGDNVRLVHGYTPVPDCPKLTKKEYNPDGETPLNDAVYKGLTGQTVYGQTLIDGGSRVKHIVVVLTDGAENASQIPATKVRALSEELLNRETYVLSYIFFGDDSQGAANAKKIGFPAQHRLTVGLDDAAIRRIFGTVSASVISTSQAKVSATSLSSNSFFS